VTEAVIIANAIQIALPRAKTGTLRFWGEWFGRPYDNWHKMVDVEALGNTLHVFFHEGERLSVHAPAGLDLAANQFRIQDAERVRWEWHSYGHPKTPENLRFMDFVKSAKGVFGTSYGCWLSKVL